MKCKFVFCDKEAVKNHRGYCQSCYRYFVMEKKIQYPLPEKGKVEFSDEGNPICHLCGKHFPKLGNHIFFNHGIKTKDYRKKFGLGRNIRLSSEDYIIFMREIQDPKTLKNLESGEETRFGGKRGNPMTLGKRAWTGRCKKCKYLSGEVCIKHNNFSRNIISCNEKETKEK